MRQRKGMQEEAYGIPEAAPPGGVYPAGGYVQPAQPAPDKAVYSGSYTQPAEGTTLGEGVIFEGAMLKGKGPILIKGKFSGTINIDGHVILSETGVITGEVRAGSAVFGGTHEGDLLVKNTLHITPTANLSGKIESGKIIIDEGAVVKGSCNIGARERQESAPKPAKAPVEAPQQKRELPGLES
ncbi:MAG: polymer-forming cytoskeletal protein [Coriobacteriia bacterium]|nr:polymer-forming cytoskeletal protein [Coriobacteriia bacterium]